MSPTARRLASLATAWLVAACATAPTARFPREPVLALLGVGPGDRVAVVGARDFAARIGEAVGAAGRVFVIDAAESEPNLPAGELDLVFTSDTALAIADRPTYYRPLLFALAPRGRLAIVADEPRSAEVARELAEAGYERIASHTLETQQRLAIFVPDDGTGE